MKTFRLLTLPLLAAAVACGSATTVVNGDLEVAVNDRMHLRVRSLDPAVRPFCDEFVAADALVADEAEMTDFRLSSKERTNDGYVLTGVYDKEGIRVEKHQKITAPAEFPGMLVVDTYYVNRGIPVTVSALVSNSLRVEADSLVWSFEPSSTSARADWILPCAPASNSATTWA